MPLWRKNNCKRNEQLEQKATAATERFHKLSDQIKSTEVALHTNMELKVATVQYAKSRPVFEKYKPFELRQPEWCVATFILPEFVNYVFFNLRKLLYPGRFGGPGCFGTRQ